MRQIAPQALTDYIAAIFAAVGAPGGTARLVAHSLVGANLTGHDSHGVIRTAQYVSYVEQQMLLPGIEPVVVSQEGAISHVDGRHGFGQRTAHFGMEHTIAVTREHGLAATILLNANHIGRVGEWVELAARQNQIGLAFCNGGSPGGLVAPHGGRGRLLGTNPFAAAVPLADEEPFILDFATSVVAEGKVRVARNKESTLPDGWILNKTGQPSNNPHDLYDQGMLLTAGLYKGFALSMLVDLLGGILTGQGAPALPRSTRFYNGVLFIALDIQKFRNVAEFLAEAREYADIVRANPARDGFDGVLIPGDPERHSAAARAAAIPLDDNTWLQIGEVAERYGVTVPTI